MMDDNNHIHDHNCDHDHCDHGHTEEGLDSIVLTLEDDTELECGVLGIFEVPEEDRDYIALVSMEDEQVLLYRYLEDQEDPEVFSLESIETDEEFDNVAGIFHELFIGEEDGQSESES
ncbi:MAG: DUF1292 domain-containing protein [Gallicola sp.]|uniref:DUF1292 domain-containing protein n=1 Tax=Gallicola sp. Sow4_E12 TaxID=3438785 RepID=UPI00183C6079|nr:DUF1292 domain-containing protein [Gallicola sp.]